MDQLSHNTVFKITTGKCEGLYRVILDEVRTERTVLVRIDYAPKPAKDNTKTGQPSKKKSLPLIGTLIWIDRNELESLYEEQQLLHVNIEPAPILLTPQGDGRAGQLFELRKTVMAPFLEFDRLRNCILAHHSIGPLVVETVTIHSVGRTFVYGCFSLLCRYGVTETSLRVRFDRCGARGVHRPCDPGGRKKAGRKTTKQQIAIATGQPSEPDQPGMSSEWQARIVAADRLIKAPKPLMPERIKRITTSHFMTSYRQEGAGHIPLDPKLGECPNRKQIIRVLNRDIPDLERVLQKTTRGHFDRTLRGAAGRSWQGVAGPGHTWAIDSTIGDIYLRSSLDRSWILGRPIVYILVDVWSTVIVGFHVCLAGPSWETAKISLFCAGADPTLIGELWGYDAMLTLDPAPTLPSVLLADRGEYLAAAARQTGLQLLPMQSYTAPYRPDYKGIVEVLHRIAKDAQYHFLPGAIDARRKEFDLRRFDPSQAVLTVREYSHFLHILFATYNLTADRAKRLDAHMKAEGVYPSPAGLWRWGHQMGIGIRRQVPFAELVSTLLPQGPMRITRSGVMFAQRQYQCQSASEEQWVTHARNAGGREAPAYYFPGTVGRIWTPNTSGSGLLELGLSDHSTASAELTVEEAVDAHAYHLTQKQLRDHANLMNQVHAQAAQASIISEARDLTAEADAAAREPRPTLTDAKRAETAANAGDSPSTSERASQTQSADSTTTDDANVSYVRQMDAFLAKTNEAERADEA